MCLNDHLTAVLSYVQYIYSIPMTQKKTQQVTTILRESKERYAEYCHSTLHTLTTISTERITTTAMAMWYDCIVLINRTLTEQERINIDHANLKVDIDILGNVTIGPKKSLFSRAMSVELTHYHHLDAILAMIACYVDPTVKSLCNYPVRQVQFAAAKPYALLHAEERDDVE